MRFRIGRGRVIYGPFSICGLPLLLPPLLFPSSSSRWSYMLSWSSLSTWAQINQFSIYLQTWETFSLASEARFISLEHVRAHVSTRLDRGQT